jgi:hypothetical protein
MAKHYLTQCATAIRLNFNAGCSLQVPFADHYTKYSYFDIESHAVDNGT